MMIEFIGTISICMLFFLPSMMMAMVWSIIACGGHAVCRETAYRKGVTEESDEQV